MKILLLLFLSISITNSVYSQKGYIKGTVLSPNGEPIEFANVVIMGTQKGTVTDCAGKFEFKKLHFEEYIVRVSYVGFVSIQKKVLVTNENPQVDVVIKLQESKFDFDQVVVTGTRTFQRKTDAPIIVGVINAEMLDAVQACDLSEGLRYQTGLRVETDCQTCNYTQLRMNGLGGGYSQILVNGRPIFSPLTGLYGLEQVPPNMIDRVEVVRGGGSALYGSSAVGGTVNIMTKIPTQNYYDFSYTTQNINNGAAERVLNGTATMIGFNGDVGLSLFLNQRQRALYDHNGDNYSELPELDNLSFGSSLFYRPTDNQKIELSFSNLNEYRYGGEMVNGPAHLAQQSEERDHNIYMSSLDYQINFNESRSSFIAYAAIQQTFRDHFTGILPEQTDLASYNLHLVNPPYGDTENSTYQIGSQLNTEFDFKGLGSTIITLGGEYVVDDIFDEINAYNYLINQTTHNLGVFSQLDWKLSDRFNVLAGLRMDHHNYVTPLILSPRFSFMYKINSFNQLRFTWGNGFRAPQAFDSDLHIAFAGGGVSRVQLSDDLTYERSSSYSVSYNFDRPTETYIYGFTLEGFYTKLDRAFVLQNVGEDEFGEIFEKVNGNGATVQGITIEARANYQQTIQIESGFTFQSSLFDDEIVQIDGLDPTRNFLRTPDNYGYANLRWNPFNQTTLNVNFLYTGSMLLTHFAGAPEQNLDEFKRSSDFYEVGLRLSQEFEIDPLNTTLQVFGGIKNIFNSYQNDFDTGKNRDSNYIYGPSMPRVLFFGVKFIP